MSDLEDSTSCDSDFEVIDCEWSGSDIEEPELDKYYEKANCFKVNGNLIHKSELTRWVKSNNPEDLRQLNALVIEMVIDDNRKAFRYLIDRGYKVSVLNDKGQTAVHLIFYDEYERALKRRGLRQLPNVQDASSFCPKLSSYDSWLSQLGGTAYKDVLPSGDLLYTMIQVWLVGRDINLHYTDHYGLTYLHAGCFVGDKLLVKKCLEAGIDINSSFHHPEIPYKNFTPLHFAVLNHMLDSSNIVRVLLKNSADVKAKDSLGRTPLHLVCRLYHASSYIRFLDNEIEQADNLAPIIIENPEKFVTKSSGIIKMLLKKHSDINTKDNLGNTPLHSIFPENYSNELTRYRSGWHDYSVPIKDMTIKFIHLVNAGADVSAVNKNGDTILHLITKNLKAWRDLSYFTDMDFDDSYHTEMVRKVLSLNSEIDVNLANNFGETPLQMAVDYLSSNIVKLLLDHGADLSNLIFKKGLFYYPNIAPNFDVIRNVVVMIESFKEVDFFLTPEASLKVLRFLLHDPSDCECVMQDERLYGICFASESHLKNILARYINSPEDFAPPYFLSAYVDNIIECNLYIDEEIRILIEMLNDLYFDDRYEIHSEIEEELVVMETTIIANSVPIYEIVANHPHNIPEHIYKNFDSKIIKDLKHFGNMLSGHMAKAMLRSYVVRSSGIYVNMLCPFLPELCCQIIGEYLSNESILNICLAVDDQDSDEISLFSS